MDDDITSATVDNSVNAAQLDSAMAFTTFYHINDYTEAGYANLPRYVATSYPLVLWAPSGLLLERCYKDESNACSISPDQFIKLVEANYIQVIGREEWFDKSWRNDHRWKDAHWLDGFDDRLVAIMRERENAPLSSRSVRIVEKEDGPAWADEYLADKSSSVVAIILNLIQEKKVPQGVQEKASGFLEKGNHREAVKIVLRDLRNHVRAKELAEAKVPFLSQKDADFFRLIEAEGKIREVRRELVVSVEMGRAIIELVERLTQPEHVISLDGFLGTNLHHELSSWFSQATDLASTFLPQDFRSSLQKLLEEYAAKGRLSESLTRRLRGQSPLFAPVVDTDALIVWLIRQVIDPDDILETSNIYVDEIPIGNGILQRAGMGNAVGRQEFPHLSSDQLQAA
ncbi:hypothetical protein [Reticulibacter mediterranei]|nr:hypothetical protein [Reticulibacter mediterranei]